MRKIASQCKVLHAFLDLQDLLPVTVFKGALLVPTIPLEWTESFMTLPEYWSDGDCGHSELVLLINLTNSVGI